MESRYKRSQYTTFFGLENQSLFVTAGCQVRSLFGTELYCLASITTWMFLRQWMKWNIVTLNRVESSALLENVTNHSCQYLVYKWLQSRSPQKKNQDFWLFMKPFYKSRSSQFPELFRARINNQGMDLIFQLLLRACNGRWEFSNLSAV